MNEGLNKFVIETESDAGTEINTAEMARLVNRGDRLFWAKRGVTSHETMTIRQRINADIQEQKAKKRKGER